MPQLTLIPVEDATLDQTRGGRGHGEYDGFLASFIAEGIRGTEVGFEGIKANSVKASLKAAIDRAGMKGQVEVRGKTLEDGEHVYLVRSAQGESEASDAA